MRTSLTVTTLEDRTTPVLIKAKFTITVNTPPQDPMDNPPPVQPTPTPPPPAPPKTTPIIG